MRKYTIKAIMELFPCEEYTEERVTYLWAGREALSTREISELEIPLDDRIWAMCKLLPDLAQRLAGADFAERVLPNYESEYPGDTRVRDAITAKRAFARGEIGSAACNAAYSAAHSAAHSASHNCAHSAAYSAALCAAQSAQMKILLQYHGEL